MMGTWKRIVGSHGRKQGKLHIAFAQKSWGQYCKYLSTFSRYLRYVLLRRLLAWKARRSKRTLNIDTYMYLYEYVLHVKINHGLSIFLALLSGQLVELNVLSNSLLRIKKNIEIWVHGPAHTWPNYYQLWFTKLDPDGTHY